MAVDPMMRDQLARALAGQGVQMAARPNDGMGFQQMQPPSQATPQGGGDPMELIMQAARRGGVDINNARPEDVLRKAWEVMPTDSMGEAIDAVSRQLGVAPPWANSAGQR